MQCQWPEGGMTSRTAGRVVAVLLAQLLAVSPALALPAVQHDTLRAISTKGTDAEGRVAGDPGWSSPEPGAAPSSPQAADDALSAWEAEGGAPAPGSVPGVYAFLAGRTGALTRAQLAEGMTLSPRTIEPDLFELTAVGVAVKDGAGDSATYRVNRGLLEAALWTRTMVGKVLTTRYPRPRMSAAEREAVREQARAEVAQLLPTRVAINGAGRIGVNLLRAWLQQDHPRIRIVALNDIAFRLDRFGDQGLKDYVELLQREFESAPRSQAGDVTIRQGQDADGQRWIAFMRKPRGGGAANAVPEWRVNIYDGSDPATLPWAANDVDVALESTGVFTNRDAAAKHLQAGAKKVIITAPATGELQTVVPGVNQELLTADDVVLSCASCTTNAIAPPLKLLSDAFGIESFYMATTHAYTADQALKDTVRPGAFLRGREAAENIIPTSTGAAKAIGDVIPALAGKGTGIALRVPVPDGSIVGITALVRKPTTVEEVNTLLRQAAQGPLKGIMAYGEQELVSRDILGQSTSSIIAGNLTDVREDGRLVTVWAWYDNEFGYSNRVMDLVGLVRETGLPPAWPAARPAPAPELPEAVTDALAAQLPTIAFALDTERQWQIVFDLYQFLADEAGIGSGQHLQAEGVPDGQVRVTAKSPTDLQVDLGRKVEPAEIVRSILRTLAADPRFEYTLPLLQQFAQAHDILGSALRGDAGIAAQPETAPSGAAAGTRAATSAPERYLDPDARGFAASAPAAPTPGAEPVSAPHVTLLAQRVTAVQGAHTGEVSIDAAIAAGATGIIAGHSETRDGTPTSIVDTDQEINAQLRAAAERPEIRTILLAVGEDIEAEGIGGISGRDIFLGGQLLAALKDLTLESLDARLVVAYEPRWAIAGSGRGRAASAQYAQSAHHAIRKVLASQFGEAFAGRTRIIYGGSVTAENAAEYLAQADIDGLLPGGASTTTEKFIPILQAAQTVAAGKHSSRRMLIAGNQKTYPVSETPDEFASALASVETGDLDVAIAPTLTALATWSPALTPAAEVAAQPSRGGLEGPAINPQFVDALDSLVAVAQGGQQPTSELYNPSPEWLAGHMRVFQDLPAEEQAKLREEWAALNAQARADEAKGKIPAKAGPDIVYRLPNGSLAFFSQGDVRRRPDLTKYFIDGFERNRDADAFDEAQQTLFAEVLPFVTRYLDEQLKAGRTVVQTDRQLTDTEDRAYHARQLLIGTKYLQIPYMWRQLTFDVPAERQRETPDILEVSFPSWQEDLTAWVEARGDAAEREQWQALMDRVAEAKLTKLVFKAPSKGLSLHLGFDYVGEHKMGPLTIAMAKARAQGDLGVQAALSVARAKTLEGRTRHTALMTIGPSLHGKSTLTIMLKLGEVTLGRLLGISEDPDEGVYPMNDDIILLQRLPEPLEVVKNGTTIRIPFAIDGTENNLYAVPFGVTQADDLVTWQALQGQPFENVPLDLETGELDLNWNIVRNMRAIVNRRTLIREKGIADTLGRITDMQVTGESVHVPMEHMDRLFWQGVMRRNDVLPPLIRLTKEQYVRALMYGEAVQQGAAIGAIGKPYVEYFSDPFIIGLEDENANILQDILAEIEAGGMPQEFFMFNTGGVGADTNDEATGATYRKIPRELTLMLQEGLLRSAVRFEHDPVLGVDVAVGLVNARGEQVLDLRRWEAQGETWSWLPADLYGDEAYAERVEALKRRRYYGNDETDKAGILRYTKVDKTLYDLGDIPLPKTEREFAWLLSYSWNLDHAYHTLNEVAQHLSEGTAPSVDTRLGLQQHFERAIRAGLTLSGDAWAALGEVAIQVLSGTVPEAVDEAAEQGAALQSQDAPSRRP